MDYQRGGLAKLLSGVEPQLVFPSGEGDFSESTRGVKVMIPVEGPVYVVELVRNMMEKWPRKSGGVSDGGISRVVKSCLQYRHTFGI